MSTIDWGRHAQQVRDELALHREMVSKGRVPASRERVQRLEQDLRHCESMAACRRRGRGGR